MGCVRPLRHLYGYATAAAQSCITRFLPCRLPVCWVAGMLTRPAGHEAETEARKSEADEEAEAQKF